MARAWSNARTATITPAVVSSSSGACEHLLVCQANLAQAIDVLKENDAWVIGLDGGSDSQPAGKVNLKGGLALVVGSEYPALKLKVLASRTEESGNAETAVDWLTDRLLQPDGPLLA